MEAQTCSGKNSGKQSSATQLLAAGDCRGPFGLLLTAPRSCQHVHGRARVANILARPYLPLEPPVTLSPPPLFFSAAGSLPQLGKIGALSSTLSPNRLHTSPPPLCDAV